MISGYSVVTCLGNICFFVINILNYFQLGNPYYKFHDCFVDIMIIFVVIVFDTITIYYYYVFT